MRQKQLISLYRILAEIGRQERDDLPTSLNQALAAMYHELKTYCDRMDTENAGYAASEGVSPSKSDLSVSADQHNEDSIEGSGDDVDLSFGDLSLLNTSKQYTVPGVNLSYQGTDWRTVHHHSMTRLRPSPLVIDSSVNTTPLRLSQRRLHHCRSAKRSKALTPAPPLPVGSDRVLRSSARTRESPRTKFNENLRMSLLKGQENLRRTPGLERSPGRTPVKSKDKQLDTKDAVDMLTYALKKKFGNVRRLYSTPSPRRGNSDMDTSLNISID